MAGDRQLTRSKRLAHAVEYGLLRATESLAGLTPRWLLLRLGAGLGRLAYAVGFYRRVVGRNMELVGWWPPDQQRQITRRLYRTMGRYAFDYLRPSRSLPPAAVEGDDILAEALAAKHGAIALLGHFGNWEVLADLFASRVGSLTVVGKPMRNPRVERWLLAKRLGSGCTVIYPDQALRRCLRVLRDGGVVVFLIDQYAGSMGTPATFLGQRTSTVRTVAGLQAKTGCAVVPVYALMQDDGTYRVVFERLPPLASPPTDPDALVTALQEQHNAVIGRWVAERPEHWFGWFHRRFKDVIEY